MGQKSFCRTEEYLKKYLEGESRNSAETKPCCWQSLPLLACLLGRAVDELQHPS